MSEESTHKPEDASFSSFLRGEVEVTSKEHGVEAGLAIDWLNALDNDLNASLDFYQSEGEINDRVIENHKPSADRINSLRKRVMEGDQEVIAALAQFHEEVTDLRDRQIRSLEV